jgi:predicted N-acetyltransferase YhbS
MPYKYVANSVSMFGGILFTPIQLTAVACYAAGPLKVRLSFRSQNVPAHLLNLSTNTDT